MTSSTISAKRNAGLLLPSWHWKSALLAVSVIALYWNTISSLVKQWMQDSSCSHGPFVPLFSAYALWRLRSRLADVPLRPSILGLLMIFAALSLLTIGVIGSEFFLQRISLILLIGGLVSYFVGNAYLRVALFPWLFLLFMVPLPAIVLNQITFPLQLLASKAAAFCIGLFGIPVLRDGNILRLPKGTIEVAEACSGLRSMLSLIAMTIAYAYAFERKLSLRFVLVLAAVPIAVTANAARIFCTGMLVQFVASEKVERFLHDLSSMVVFAFSLVIILLFHLLVLRRFYARAISTSAAP